MRSLKRLLERTSVLSISLLFAACGSSGPVGNLPPIPTSQSTNTAPAATPTPTAVSGGRTVFLIMMENHNWSDIKNSPSAPYINKTVLPMASYAEQYYNPPGIHPSEPNYLWLEAGSNLGITDDADPNVNHQSTPLHLVTLLNTAGISWKSYQEGISGTVCPLTGDGLYAPKHNPMIFFDDVTNTNDPHSAYCIAHVRPYSELTTDLQHNTQARYNFITPDLCNDMHDTCTFLGDAVKQGDTWLAQNLPAILNSQAYQSGGIVFIAWDEGEGGDGPIGMIVLSPNAKGGGYSNTIHYTHSSLLRTLQEIFGVTPLLGDAATATDLRDLFTT
ncbi:MAG: phosphoesterase, partial [Ktedonobacteraceae bacterium]|nr:phosphoesterase [Ktedonobacteraceae bacterium]